MEAALRPARDVVARAVDGQMVVVNLATNEIYSLSSTATVVWESIQLGLQREEIVRRLHTQFVTRDIAVEDELDALVADLRSRGLLAARDDAA
jgi:hypothetical protein